MDHRWGRRRVADVAVRFFALPAVIGTGKVVDVSMSGAFMETDVDLRPLSLIYLETMDSGPREGRKSRLAASVVRRTGSGVGLEWCERGAFQTASPRDTAQIIGEIYHYRFDFVDPLPRDS